MSKDDIIDSVEKFYFDRLNKLVNEERFDDSNAVFEEFVVYGEEPNQWLFIDFIDNVC